MKHREAAHLAKVIQLSERAQIGTAIGLIAEAQQSDHIKASCQSRGRKRLPLSPRPNQPPSCASGSACFSAWNASVVQRAQ